MTSVYPIEIQQCYYVSLSLLLSTKSEDSNSEVLVLGSDKLLSDAIIDKNYQLSVLVKHYLDCGYHEAIMLQILSYCAGTMLKSTEALLFHAGILAACLGTPCLQTTCSTNCYSLSMLIRNGKCFHPLCQIVHKTYHKIISMIIELFKGKMTCNTTCMSLL